MQTNLKNRATALGTLAVLTATTLGGAAFTPAHATKARTWGTAAVIGGLVTGYGLVKKDKTAAIAGGVATAYSYSRYRSDKKKDDRAKEAKRRAWYQQRYGRNWRNYYQPGA